MKNGDMIPDDLRVDRYVHFWAWMQQIKKLAKEELTPSDFASEESFDAKVVSIIQDVTDHWFETFVAHVKNELIKDQEPLDLTKLKSAIDELLGGTA